MNPSSELMARLQQAEPAIPPASDEDSRGGRPRPRGRMSNDGGILIVDDDARFAALAESVLAEAGYRCRTAANGEVALAAAWGEQPRIVLLDVHLPVMSGYDVCRRLRERYGLSVGIIFISGCRVESYDQVAGLELGGDDYLSKPFDPGEFVARVRSLARRLTVARPAAGSHGEPEHPLTARELEVLALAAEGLAQKQIAHQLSISFKTVGTHMSHIFEKLGVHSRGQAVAVAHELHLLGPLLS
jgi:DNA-binding NarL/FixJ family response regulator